MSAVESILTLDRLRQSVAIKELLQAQGQPLMRKTASVPNFSQVLLFFCHFGQKSAFQSVLYILVYNLFFYEFLPNFLLIFLRKPVKALFFYIISSILYKYSTSILYYISTSSITTLFEFYFNLQEISFSSPLLLHVIFNAFFIQ